MPNVQSLVANNLNIWTTAIQKKISAGRGTSKRVNLYGIKKLRELILDLAVRGQLTAQDPSDEPASELLEQIAAEKEKLVEEGEIKKQKVILTVPKTGEKKKLLNLIKTNIELNISGKEKRIEDLKNVLNLNETPNIIECFDISHLSGTKTVASMVQFKNGKANKSNYRKFRIRETHGIDDYGSLKEVVRRRYTGLIKNKLPMPDLIIIDGGKGQLSSCIEELEILKITTPIISIAKREEEIFTPNNPESIILDSKQPAINLVKEIRDEAHRFAINYNRLLRRKEMLD